MCSQCRLTVRSVLMLSAPKIDASLNRIIINEYGWIDIISASKMEIRSMHQSCVETWDCFRPFRSTTKPFSCCIWTPFKIISNTHTDKNTRFVTLFEAPTRCFVFTLYKGEKRHVQYNLHTKLYLRMRTCLNSPRDFIIASWLLFFFFFVFCGKASDVLLFEIVRFGVYRSSTSCYAQCTGHHTHVGQIIFEYIHDELTNGGMI